MRTRGCFAVIHTLFYIFLITGWLPAGIVELAWEPVSGAGPGYHVYRSTDGENFRRLTGSSVRSASYEDRTAEVGTLYYYRVTAVRSGGGESDFSNRVAAIAGGEADLEIQLEAPADPMAGTRVSFPVTVFNHGTGPNGSALQVSIPLPPGLTWSGWSGLDWSCLQQPQSVSCASEVILLPRNSSRFSLHFWLSPRVDPEPTLRASLATADGVVEEVAHRLDGIRYGLYLPHYLTEEADFASLSLTNHSTTTATVGLTAYDRLGSPLVPGGGEPPIMLPPGEQHSELNYERQPAASGQLPGGWLGLVSDTPGVGGFFQFGDRRLYRLDGAALLQEVSREAFFTRVLSGEQAFLGRPAQTWLSIINPSDEPITVEAQLVRTNRIAKSLVESVSSRKSVPLALAPKALFQARPEDIFGDMQGITGYVRLKAVEGDGFVAFERVELQGGASAVGISAGTARSHRLYSAQLAHAADVFTHLELINTSDERRDVRLLASGEQGQELAAPVELSLLPGETLSRTLEQVFQFPAGQRISGSLEIQADGPGLTGDVIFGDPVMLEYAASLPLQPEPFERASFHYLANTEDVYTGLAVFNVGLQPALVTLEVFDPDGNPLAWTELELGPQHRISRTLTELIPEVRGQVGGYLRLESTQPVVAQQLFGHTRLAFLSAVPATALP